MTHTHTHTHTHTLHTVQHPETVDWAGGSHICRKHKEDRRGTGLLREDMTSCYLYLTSTH
jgi:hypothetical protein